MTPRDDDFAEEARDFLERAAEDHRRAGASPAEAERLARATLGSVTAIRSEIREGTWRGTWSGLLQDLRFGARLFRRAPAFSLTAIIVLALGIGANTALFSVVYALFLAPAPIPSDLVSVYKSFGTRTSWGISRAEQDIIRERGQDIGTFSKHGPVSLRLNDERDDRRLMGEAVDGNYFSLFGIVPVAGRFVDTSDDVTAATTPAMVIGEQLWKTAFESDAGVIGRTVTAVDGGGRRLTLTIVGVAPEGFKGVNDPWTPSQFWVSANEGQGGAPLIRLKPGRTLEQCRALIESATLVIRDQYRQGPLGGMRMPPAAIDRLSFPAFRTADVRLPFDPETPIVPRGIVAALVGVAAVVLLIGTANIAGLLLARGVTRSGELAVRRALGASGGRLTRQLATEALLLTVIAGAVGVGLAWGLVRVFTARAPAAFASVPIELDWRAMLCVAVLCLGTAALVAIAPALQARQLRLTPVLGSGPVTDGWGRLRMRRWIVVPQVGLSLILLVGAAVHLRALVRVDSAPRGYEDEGVVVANVEITRAAEPRIMVGPREELVRAAEQSAARMRGMYQSLIDAIRAQPAVQSAALAANLPLRLPTREPGHFELRDGTGSADGYSAVVTDGYFEVMRMSVLAGRVFDSRDVATTPPVIVVSESMARELAPDGSVVGRSIAVGQDVSGGLVTREIVGVVADAKPVLAPGRPMAQLYLPASQLDTSTTVLLRTPFLLVRAGSGDRAALTSVLKRAGSGVRDGLDVISVRPLTYMTDEILYPQRLAASVLIGAALVGLTLAAIGLYGVTAYSAVQRRRELGIRVALGATPRDLVRLVVGETLRSMAIGAIAALAVAVVVVRVTATLLPGLPAIDMYAFIGMPIVVAVVVALASFLPARRASAIDPAHVLKG